MPKPNAVVARVVALPEAAPDVTEAAAAGGEPVELEGGRKAVLPPGRRAAAWRGMLEYTQHYGLPAYVEIDPETRVITRVLIPMRATVVALEPTADGDVGVRMIESHAGHHLLRSHPDFQDMLNALEGARASGEAVLVTSTRDEHEIIDVREAPAPPTTGPPPDDPPPSVVTEAQAAQLFNDMAATTCDPSTVPPGCIPFMYPDDGCYARAHEMARLMRLQSIEAEKIWIYASSNSNLNPAAANHPNCKVNWWYHVAPTLQVQTASGIEKRVIDPSLMTGPATPDAWRQRQSDPAATFEFTDATPFWPKPNYTPDDVTYTLTNQYLAEKRALLLDRTADYGPPPYACPIVKKAAFILDRSTFGQDEVTAMLQGANPAIIEAALYVVLDGFTPQEIGITGSTPTDPPTLKPTLTVNPLPAQMEIRAAHLDLEDPAHLIRRQRITWTYEVRFVGTSGFNFATDTLSVALGATIAGQSAAASLLLIKQPNPYEIDGSTHWLSTDLRVFQINAGQSRFSATMGASAAQAPAFIQQVINNLNAGTTGGQTFDTALSTDQQTSKLELSEAVAGTKVFNFAVARVRYRGTLPAQDVRAFFRLFPASTTSLAYDPSTTYRRGGQGGVKVPLLGVQANQLITIPCFASPRVDSASTSLAAQTDTPNVRTIAASATERQVYFGAWLDINQTAPQFPLSPSPVDGPFSSGRQSVYQLVRSAHQCLVAEIAFDPTPIPQNVTPGASDKLAQRNLAIVESANPGVVGSRRIPQTFEIKATVEDLPDGTPPDELLIDWGRTPVGSTATLYLPEADAEAILDTAAEMYRTSNLVLIDEHTIQTRTGGMSWIPIPQGSGNLTGLLTIDLPRTVREGQAFTIVARQVTGRVGPVVEDAAFLAAAAPAGRRILGSFQITIPVQTKEILLTPQQRLLSNLRFIEQAIPATDRWFPTFHRYVTQVASRVDGLGGSSDVVGPSPSGDWEAAARESLVCRTLELASIALMAMLVVIWAASGLARIVLGLIDLSLLALVAYVWVTTCRPNAARLLRALLIGVVVGLVILLVVLGLGP
jgi:hypothetical protein